MQCCSLRWYFQVLYEIVCALWSGLLWRNINIIWYTISNILIRALNNNIHTLFSISPVASSPENAKAKDDAFVLTEPVYSQDCASSSAANSPTTADAQVESPAPQNGQESSEWSSYHSPPPLWETQSKVQNGFQSHSSSIRSRAAITANFPFIVNIAGWFTDSNPFTSWRVRGAQIKSAIAKCGACVWLARAHNRMTRNVFQASCNAINTDSTATQL